LLPKLICELRAQVAEPRYCINARTRGLGPPHVFDRRWLNDTGAAPELARLEQPSMTSEIGLAKVLPESYRTG
jgi:hypothetical protein